MENPRIVVQPKNTASGEFAKLGDANKALGSGTDTKCIFINPGTYDEKVTVNYGGLLTIYGYTTDTSKFESNQVTITTTTSSAATGGLDKSAAVNFLSKVGLKVYNINFSNTFGLSGQAVAIAANGDKQGFYGCQFFGHQDTFYAKNGHQYYKGYYMEGSVDFIFGGASAWFESCTIAVNRDKGVITAMSRGGAAEATWYVFNQCTVRAASGATVGAKSVKLGRPWGIFARVMYKNSDLSEIISDGRYGTMAEKATPDFEEFKNTGKGADTSNRKFFTKSTAAVNQSAVLTGDLSWIDQAY
ncbi:hypothetical protein HYALB_00005025 [Hymenoscyphus albidus]|uniref:pectinesterase n=1 Tax=Hymenoscyphus albidus TaxID=595503 RepID=A0A9N9LGN2_9HELO|nr:hypothetical protein HYALB_00005025 [Hymenoscyphus albidus]